MVLFDPNKSKGKQLRCVKADSQWKAFSVSTGARFGSLTVVVAFVHGENSHDPANFEENW